MTRNYYIVGAALIAAVFVATALAYPHLPDLVPVHWDAHGDVNGMGSKWTLFTIDPGIMLESCSCSACCRGYRRNTLKSTPSAQRISTSW